MQRGVLLKRWSDVGEALAPGLKVTFVCSVAVTLGVTVAGVCISSVHKGHAEHTCLTNLDTLSSFQTQQLMDLSYA